MSLNHLPRWLASTGTTQHLLKLLQAAAEPTAGQRTVGLHGVAAASRPFVTAAIAPHLPGGLVVARDGEAARRWVAELEGFGLDVWSFPAVETSPYEGVSPEDELLAQRQATLAALHAGEARWVVTTPKALALRLPLPPAWGGAAIELAVGSRIAPTTLVGQLVRLGYRPAAQVVERGSFSRRGELLDLFPPQLDQPVRIEFFDEDIERMRAFDPDSQRSDAPLERLAVFPMRGIVLPETGWPAIEARIRKAFDDQQKKLKFVAGRLKARTDQDLTRFAAFGYFDGCEGYAPFLYERMGTLVDYLPGGSVLVWDDHEHLFGELVRWCQAQDAALAKNLEEGNILPLPYPLHLDAAGLAQLGTGLAQLDVSSRAQAAVTIDAPASPRFHSDFDQIAIRINGWQHEGQRVVIVTQQPQRAFAILDERGVNASLSSPPEDAGGQVGGVWVVREGLIEGFSVASLRLVVLTDLELFGQQRRASARHHKKFSFQGTAFTNVAELKPGDYVVHAKHGIGRFVGLARLPVDNQERDYLALVYHNDDKLYVPVDQVNLLHRYRGQGDGPSPKLHKMGGVEWENTKKRVKKGLKDLADDLVKLYAARASLEGYAYPPDTLWQQEMEEAFPYEPTIDQLKAIEETKRDMERPRPMDRLVCGDVGFGKTEVALRAAFKAIMAGKQVALLAPTTVLAQQHYLVFRERFAPYPVRVGLLSRFRTPKEQREVIAKLKTGEIDLVVGTHRVLGKDLGFKDLGLVIIDEEHRFGVANKERLKQVKRLVDVLTMSATPIPRTLYMALSGARDMSLIATPPLNRQPIKTFVGPYDPDAVRAAVLHEMERGGQIFFLHNRVESIGRIAVELEALVPEARIRYAHGQMSEDDLEDIMLAFKDGEFDILLSTTIIESGLDIPRANTMIIDDADRLGLAQLYQLRGRVGRSETKAYCHCFYRAGKQLTDEARDRLGALQQFTALGSGYQIALRDLEIRGVGNLLGSEQHGHMISVGFDLYSRLLEEAIEESRGHVVEAAVEPATVDLHVSAFIPDEWIGEGGDKMAQYRRLAGVSSERELEILEAEWKDRFGALPTSVRNLMRVVRLKLQASELGLAAIRSDTKFIRIQGAIPASAFYKAQASDKSLVNWKFTPQEVQIDRTRMLPEDQLVAVEKLLKPLLAAAAATV
ncbi:MAG: transcription-repair coupling factor [Candidatus Sericytochromatia bacterium]|nr:transcription-repair coupling factor [Candidatus Sericytochromatia bacterium]